MTPRTLAADVDTLGRCLGDVIREQEGAAVLALEEQVRVRTRDLRERGEDTAPMQAELARLGDADAARLVRAFSIYFQLVNTAEEHERIRSLARRGGTRPESLAAAFEELSRLGFDATRTRALLRETDLGLTFTAHPTEMRRRTVRGHLDAISELLYTLDRKPGRLPDGVGKPGATEARITAHIEALWTTPQLRERRPSVRDEVNAGLAYVDVIGSVLPALERDMKAAFEAVFHEPLGDVPLPLSFHSWVGGDRDGNPNVTPEVTRDTFELHATRARATLLEEIRRGFGWLSQTRSLTDPGDEPFRRMLQELHDAVAGGALVDVEAAVERLEGALRAAGQERSAAVLLQPLRARARTFGLHLASLDVREHSDAVGKAVAELLARSGVDYLALPEEGRVRLLVRELETHRPLLGAAEVPSAELENVLGALRAARAATRTHGPRAFGRYIVSMCDQPSDLLEVLVLAREIGVPLIPVPLFETLDALARAPAIMREVLALPVYRRVVEGGGLQEIMIGYSDSNKDGGFFAATFALHEAQENVARSCTEAGVAYRFFHGRGTSIGRGGGPMARGLLAQPAGTMTRGLRITEQGEALGNKYSHPQLAFRNLEQGLYGLVVAAGRGATPLPDDMREQLRRAAAASVRAYRALVEDPGFLAFFEAVTPIGEIARLEIASRPVRRPGPPTLKNLRAIPWVMAWTQCRANVPGWYGLDAALEVLGDRARECYERWPFFRSSLQNAEMSLAKSDLTVFRAYRALSVDDSLGEQIEAAFTKTRARLEAVTGAPLLDQEGVLARSINLRNPYIEPIHRLQVELIRRARAVGEDQPLPPEIERPLLLTLHGIAAGMRNTG